MVGAVKFEPTFSLGQVGVLVGTILTGCGIIYTFASQVQSATITVKDEMRAAIAKIETSVSETKAENMLQNQRIDALDRERLRTQQEDATFRSEVRQSLTTLSGDLAKLLGDVRVISATTSKQPETRR